MTTAEPPKYHGNSLEGTRVLVVEDEFYIADDLARCLREAGAVVLGPVPSVDRALEAIADEAPDCAVLDLNLHGDSAAPIAERLNELRIPFAISTGYDRPPVPDRFQSVPRCEKPFDPAELIRVLARLSPG